MQCGKVVQVTVQNKILTIWRLTATIRVVPHS